MKFGLSDEQFKFINEHVVSPLKAKGAKVWIYGSRARGDHQPFSDLDLMVESKDDLSSLISQIEEFITNSNFPFKLDLVELRLFAESYRASFDSDKKQL